MTRATRQLAIALPVVVVYLLMLLGVIGVPVISEQRAGEVLPVVRLRPLLKVEVEV